VIFFNILCHANVKVFGVKLVPSTTVGVGDCCCRTCWTSIMSRLIKKPEVNDTDFGHVIGRVRLSLTVRRGKIARREQSMWCWVRVCTLVPIRSQEQTDRCVVPDSLAFPCATQKVFSKGLCAPAQFHVNGFVEHTSGNFLRTNVRHHHWLQKKKGSSSSIPFSGNKKNGKGCLGFACKIAHMHASARDSLH